MNLKKVFLLQLISFGPVFIDIPINIKTNILKVNFGFQNEIFKSAYNKDNIREKIKAYIKDFIKSKRPTFLIGVVSN